MSLLRPVLLAAGRSTRFEGGFKLLQDLGGAPVVLRSARALRDADLGRPLVVTGSHAPEVCGVLLRALGEEVELLPNPAYRHGMATSVALAARCVREGEGMLVALADMPLLTAADHCAVASALDADDPESVARGAVDGVPGHPVAFGSAWPRRMERLTGDRGAAALLKDRPVRLVELPEPSQIDVDTGAALERARRFL